MAGNKLSSVSLKFCKFCAKTGFGLLHGLSRNFKISRTSVKFVEFLPKKPRFWGSSWAFSENGRSLEVAGVVKIFFGRNFSGPKPLVFRQKKVPFFPLFNDQIKVCFLFFCKNNFFQKFLRKKCKFYNFTKTNA